MKKFTGKLITIILAITMAVSAIPISVSAAGGSFTSSEPVTSEEALVRIDELVRIMDGKYFTVNKRACEGTWHESCGNCRTENIMNQSWFKNTFGEVKVDQLPTTATYPRAYSCAGFGGFAMWYIWKTDITDAVRATTVVNTTATVDNYRKYAKPGDLVRLNSRHTIIFIGIDGNNIIYLDSNGNNADPCRVAKRTGMPYANKPMTIYRAKNYTGTTPSTTVNADNVPEGTYYLASALNGAKSAISISGDSKSSKANAHLWNRHTGDSEKFIVRKTGSQYTLTNLNSGLLLDVKNGSRLIGANVWQYTSNNTNSQKWTFENAGNGYMYIKSALGNYLDVSNGKTKNGTNIGVWSKNNTNSQKWKLIPCYYLDVNGCVNGKHAASLKNVATFDVYVDGECVANDVSDYHVQIAGKYEIKDVRPMAGYKYNGVAAGTSYGNMTGAKNVVLSFSK